jgi:DNA-binding NtrC family response regulator
MLKRFEKDASRRLSGFSPDAIAAIPNYGWPGNVRELIDRVRRTIVMSESRQITARDLELGEIRGSRAGLARASARSGGTPGNRTGAAAPSWPFRRCAQELGISRVTLYRVLTA